ncbi:hypothetical protein EC991_008818 [Linnemannia zychae]|nr:hypothetical protein EC991_008818 [Linnemannia zychae]
MHIFFIRYIIPISAKTALVEARPHIDAVRQTGNTNHILNHYREAKGIFGKVNPKKEDAPSLKDMRVAFLELADILTSKGPVTQDKAEKCRRRADDLEKHLFKRQERNRMMELRRINTIVAAIPVLPQIADEGWSKGTLIAGTAAISSTTASTTTSTDNTVFLATLNSQHQPRSTPQATPSFSAPISPAISPLLFSQKANRVPFVHHLPAPGEQLENTRQLTYCLALSQKSWDETSLDLDTLNWRINTLKNSKETTRMEEVAHQVVREFTEGGVKNAAQVDEVVQLAQVLHKEPSRSLLMSLVNTVRDSTLLHLHAMEGLAIVIQGAAPGSIDSNDLVTILGILHERLQTIHIPSTSHLYSLLFSVSRVLDAMETSQVGKIDRVTLHGPLTALLHDLESHQNPCVAFQAEYATQALLNITDNDTIWQAGFRRGWLVLKGAAGFAKMPDPREIKDALEGLERLYDTGNGAARLLNNTWVAVKAGEMPTFNTVEGLKFKRVWYHTLRTAEDYLQIGDLKGFKELWIDTRCRHELMFQLGICQLLGRFMVDAQWDLESRRSTLAFLGDLCISDDIWKRQERVTQVISNMIFILAINHKTDFEAAEALQKMLQRQNLVLTPLDDLQSHPWYSFLSTNPISHTTSPSTLLMAVQNQRRNEENMSATHSTVEHIKDRLCPSQYSLKDIQSALKIRYKPDLVIRRISGKELDLATCYVNLAIVDSPEQREKEKQNLKEQAAVFCRIPSSETVRGSNIQSSIRLEQLFDKRMLRDGKEGIPQRVLVQGRAGIGKTTLCKKLVHEHQNGLWNDRFDAVLWLRLRQLRGSMCRTLESLLRQKFIGTQQTDREQEGLASTLAIRAKEGKVLFILDGLDEIATDAQGECNSLMSLLQTLLGQQHVIITSRPSGLNRVILPQIDLELETIGFSQENVKTFVTNVLDPEPAKTVHDFIQRTPLMQGLVNIPVQLDVICFCWNSLPMDGSQVTMTKLYQLMVRELWRKDALLLEKAAGGNVLKEQEINDLSAKSIDKQMTAEMHHLGFQAFKGLVNDHQIEFDHKTLLETFDDLEDYRESLSNGHTSPQILNMLKKTSFLHAVDADLDPDKSESKQTWSFLHLTFQEYFAAIWITSRIMAPGDDGAYHVFYHHHPMCSLL